jgi:hypothetical protein
MLTNITHRAWHALGGLTPHTWHGMACPRRPRRPPAVLIHDTYQLHICIYTSTKNHTRMMPNSSHKVQGLQLLWQNKTQTLNIEMFVQLQLSVWHTCRLHRAHASSMMHPACSYCTSWRMFWYSLFWHGGSLYRSSLARYCSGLLLRS